MMSPQAAQARKSAFMLSSVGARFRKQLQGLMATLSSCNPHYIRCAGVSREGVRGPRAKGLGERLG